MFSSATPHKEMTCWQSGPGVWDGEGKYAKKKMSAFNSVYGYKNRFEYVFFKLQNYPQLLHPHPKLPWPPDFFQLSLRTANFKGQSQDISMNLCNWSRDKKEVQLVKTHLVANVFSFTWRRRVIGSLRRCGCERLNLSWLVTNPTRRRTSTFTHKKNDIHTSAHFHFHTTSFPHRCFGPNCGWSAIAIQPQCEVFRFCAQFLDVFLWWNTTDHPKSNKCKVTEGSRCTYLSSYLICIYIYILYKNKYYVIYI